MRLFVLFPMTLSWFISVPPAFAEVKQPPLSKAQLMARVNPLLDAFSNAGFTQDARRIRAAMESHQVSGGRVEQINSNGFKASKISFLGANGRRHFSVLDVGAGDGFGFVQFLDPSKATLGMRFLELTGVVSKYAKGHPRSVELHIVRDDRATPKQAQEMDNFIQKLQFGKNVSGVTKLKATMTPIPWRTKTDTAMRNGALVELKNDEEVSYKLRLDKPGSSQMQTLPLTKQRAEALKASAPRLWTMNKKKYYAFPLSDTPQIRSARLEQIQNPQGFSSHLLRYWTKTGEVKSKVLSTDEFTALKWVGQQLSKRKKASER